MLLDSNIIIYAGQAGHAPLLSFLNTISPMASAISYVEVLGYPKLTQAQENHGRAFFAMVLVLPVNAPVIEQAARLRRMRRMSVGDAIIAATALVHGLTLVTRNVADFNWIPGLPLLNPFQSTSPPPTP